MKMSKREALVKSLLTLTVVTGIAGITLSEWLNNQSWMILTILGCTIAMVVLIWLT